MSSPPTKEQSHQKLNRELRDVISILTGLGKTRNGDSDDGLGIVTLAGTNKGAVMKMEGPEAAIDQISATVNRNGREGTEAFANSNYQSINNSIVIGGSCGAEDPGVHLLVQDYVEGDEGDDGYDEAKSEEKKKEISEDEKQLAEAKNEERGDEERSGDGEKVM